MIKNDWQADKAIEEIKELESEIARLEKLANKKIEQIKASFDSSKKSLEFDINRLKESIKTYVMTNPEGKVNATDTLIKYQLNAGHIKIKKEGYSIVSSGVDKKALMEYLKQTNRNDLIKEKVSYSPDWSAYKSKLRLKDNKVVDIDTGEALDFIKPKYKEMEVNIK